MINQVKVWMTVKLSKNNNYVKSLRIKLKIFVKYGQIKRKT